MWYDMSRRLIAAAIVGSTVASGAPAMCQTPSPAGAGRSDTISYDSLMLELAVIQKTTADELFLRNEVVNAKREYEDAQKLIARLDSARLPSHKSNVVLLLKTDIEYRLLLLQRGLGFWGGYRSLTPSIPVVHLQRMQRLLQDFETYSSEIESAIQRSAEDQKEIQRLAALSQEANGRMRAETINDTRLEMKARESNRVGQTIESRIASLERQREMLQRAGESVRAEREKLEAGLEKKLISAAASAVGVPPGLMDAAQTGDIKAAAVALIADPEVQASLANISEETATLVDLYKQAESAHNTVQDYQRAAEQVVDLVRAPTLENLARAGAVAYERLPTRDQERLERTVRDSRPGRLVGDLLRSGADLQSTARRVCIEFLSNNDSALSDLRRNLEAAIGQSVVPAREQLLRLIGGIDATTLTEAESRSAVTALLKHWSKQVLSSMPAEVRAELRARANMPSDEALAELLASRGAESVPGVSVERGRVRVRMAGRPAHEIDLGALLRIPTLQNTVAEVDSARQQLLEVVAELSERNGNLRKQVLSVLDVSIIERATLNTMNLSSGSANSRERQLWGMLMRSEDADEIMKRATEMTLGSAVASTAAERDEVDAKQRAAELAAGAPLPVPTGESPEPNSLTNQLVARALDYAFPGAGVALEILQGMAASSAMAKEEQRIADERRQVMQQQAHLEDMAHAAVSEEGLALKEAEVARVLRQAAQEQYETYRFSISRLVQPSQLQLARARLRKSLVFYLAERMREEFDLLDRSLALWGGYQSAPTRTIESLIKADPRNVRLAIDSEIHLFDWLNRDLEASRTDVDALVVHWRQILRLCIDLCDSVGCVPGDGQLGQVQQTRQMSLRELATRVDWKRFKDWQASPSAEPFEMSFLLHPSMRIVPLRYQNIRVVDVRLGSITSSGRVEAVNQVELEHPGIGYIPLTDDESPGARKINFHRELSLARSSSTFDKPEPFSLEALSARWRQGTPSTKFFEGYGLYTAWTLRLQPTPENKSVHDIALRFAYHYLDTSNVLTEASYVKGTDATPAGWSVGVPLFEWRFVEASQAANAGSAEALAVDPLAISSVVDVSDPCKEEGSQTCTPELARLSKRSTLSVRQVCKSVPALSSELIRHLRQLELHALSLSSAAYDPSRPENAALEARLHGEVAKLLSIRETVPECAAGLPIQ